MARALPVEDDPERQGNPLMTGRLMECANGAGINRVRCRKPTLRLNRLNRGCRSGLLRIPFPHFGDRVSDQRPQGVAIDIVEPLEIQAPLPCPVLAQLRPQFLVLEARA